MLLLLDSMAERYSMLPTDILSKATTQDLFIYNNANTIKIREHRKEKGESVADTYSQNELDSIYKDFKNKYGNENK